MFDGGKTPVNHYFLKPGYAIANRDDTVVRAVLGNSVAVTLFDRAARRGGMCHFILPTPPTRELSTSQYGRAGIVALWRMLSSLAPAGRTSLTAQIIGGASRPRIPDEGLGAANVEAARETLAWLKIPVVSEDVGGQRGRKVLYQSGTDELGVFKVDTLRESDWFLRSADLRFAEEPRRRASAHGERRYHHV
jgi:chemotaxis protein CheD